MKPPKLKDYPQAKKFILEVINTQRGYKALAGKSFAEIVKFASGKGYKITEADLLGELNHYYKNEFPLPYWIQARLGALSTWDGWQREK
jgi:hypothetical protein